MAYTFFDNYHETIKEFANGNLETYGRLMLIINSYAIEGVILDDLTQVEKLFFNIVKPNLDKSLKMRERGKQGGRPRLKPNLNMVKTKNDLGFYEEEEEREIELEYEVENEKEEEKNITQSELLKLCTEKGLFLDSSFLTSSFIKKINNKYSNPLSAAGLRLDYVLKKYQDKDNEGKAAMFVKSFSWDDIPEVKPTKTKKTKSIDYSLAPKKCDECGASVTPWGVPNSVKCTACSKTWELNNGLWLSTN